jgi:hypothetical protein
MPQQQLYLPLAGDFVINSNGGLQFGGTWDTILQNIERFIFTNAATLINGVPQPADWIFYPNFGLSANSMLGQPFTSSFISQLQQVVYQGVLSAITGNSSVPPVVTVTQGANPQQLNVSVVITPNNGSQVSLNIQVP